VQGAERSRPLRLESVTSAEPGAPEDIFRYQSSHTTRFPLHVGSGWPRRITRTIGPSNKVVSSERVRSVEA
jgi:hypothetical protein